VAINSRPLQRFSASRSSSESAATRASTRPAASCSTTGRATVAAGAAAGSAGDHGIPPASSTLLTASGSCIVLVLRARADALLLR